MFETDFFPISDYLKTTTANRMKRIFKRGRAIGSQDSRKSFTHSEKYILRSECLHENENNSKQKSFPDVLSLRGKKTKQNEQHVFLV